MALQNMRSAVEAAGGDESGKTDKVRTNGSLKETTREVEGRRHFALVEIIQTFVHTR